MTKKPVLLFACAGIDEAAWLSALNAALPDVELRIWPEVGDPAEIECRLGKSTIVLKTEFMKKA